MRSTRILLACVLILAPMCVLKSQMRIPGPGGSSPGGGVVSTVFVTSTTTGTARNDYSGCVGFIFTVGGSNITLTDIGRWVISGNSGTHTLSVIGQDTGTLVASASLNTSGKTAGQYAYVSVTPATLTSGTRYFISSQETASADQWYDDNTLISGTAVATINWSGVSSGCTTANTNSSGGHSYVPMDFKYQ